MDHVSEVTLPEGILRVELDSVEVDGSGHVAAYLNGAPISKKRAAALVEKARRKMENVSECQDGECQ